MKPKAFDPQTVSDVLWVFHDKRDEPLYMRTQACRFLRFHQLISGLPVEAADAAIYVLACHDVDKMVDKDPFLEAITAEQVAIAQEHGFFEIDNAGWYLRDGVDNLPGMSATRAKWDARERELVAEHLIAWGEVALGKRLLKNPQAFKDTAKLDELYRHKEAEALTA